jgi:hypothetical protein
LNDYQYALNNPIMNTDPGGTAVCLCGMDPETGLCHPCSDRYSFLPPFLAQTVSELGLSLNNPIVIAIIAAISCLSIMGNFLVREAPSLPDIFPGVFPKREIDRYGGRLMTGEKAGPVIWERGKTEPEHAPTPLGRDIIPRITETPKPLRKHISLGRSSIDGRGALEEFTYKLNMKLNPEGIYVYIANNWKDAGLSDIHDLSKSGFGVMFFQASMRAEHIHFNLEGISTRTINMYINTYGGLGDISQAKLVTAAELYIIRHSGLCSKTSFYTNGSVTPSPSAKGKVCNTQ